MLVFYSSSPCKFKVTAVHTFRVCIVAGVVLSTLLKRRPDLKNELHTLRTTLLEQSSDSHEELKVWNMKDLGIQVHFCFGMKIHPSSCVPKRFTVKLVLGYGAVSV